MIKSEYTKFLGIAFVISAASSSSRVTLSHGEKAVRSFVLIY